MISILIVDKEKSVFELLQNILYKLNYSIAYSSSLKDAREKINSAEPDIIICSLVLSDDNGFVLVEEIKKSKPNIPVIILTTQPSFESIQHSMHLGVHDYLIKPLEVEDIKFAIKRAVEFRQLSLTNKYLMEQLERQNIVLEQRVRDRTQHLNLLYETGQEISSLLDMNELLEAVINNILNALQVEICSILLYDAVAGELKVAAACGLPPEAISTTIVKPGESVSGWVFVRQDAVLVKDIEIDERFSKKNLEKYYTHSLISVTLKAKGKSIGVLNVNNKKSRQPFYEDELWLIKSIASQATIAIDNAKLFSELENTYLQTVLALTSAIDARDHYTGAHSEHVMNYAMAIAKEMKFNEEEIEIIKQACQLHDIGKIAVQDCILTKPGKLTAEEWVQIKQHSARGAEILQPLIFLDGSIDLVRQHHERYDGNGYPLGLKGEAIEIGARIIAVADSFDAMTTDRPYQKALTREEAIQELIKNKGKQFDSQVVDAFLKIIERETKNGQK